MNFPIGSHRSVGLGYFSYTLVFRHGLSENDRLNSLNFAMKNVTCKTTLSLIELVTGDFALKIDRFFRKTTEITENKSLDLSTILISPLNISLSYRFPV